MRNLFLVPIIVFSLSTAHGEDIPAVFVNHVGFVPHSAKYCVIEGTESLGFSVVEKENRKEKFCGQMKPYGGGREIETTGRFCEPQRISFSRRTSSIFCLESKNDKT